MARVRRFSNPSYPYLAGVNHFKVGVGDWVFVNNVMTPSWGYHSEGTCVDDVHPGPPYRTGGGLMIFSYQCDPGLRSQGTYYASNIGNVTYRYVGGFYPQAALAAYRPGCSTSGLHSEVLNPGSQPWGYSRASSYGATGWNRYRPGNPTASLGQFLGEMRDVPRMLKGTAKFFRNLWKSLGGSPTGFGPKAVADYWLNTQFGWRPFLSDLRRFYRTSMRINSHIARIRSRNGHWQRVGGPVWSASSTEVISESGSLTAHLPALTAAYYVNPSSPGSRSYTRVTSQKAWFEGAFRFWIPKIDSVNWERRTVVELFGLMPNPALIWELMPWSWLVDWGSNTGDVIANLTTGYADNLAAKYAYSMKGTELVGECSSTCRLKSGVLQDVWTFPMEWKERIGANPFGFGLTDDMLSIRQWSILAALGITHRR